MISVIIPAYNAQAYLRECLESVLAQSFSDWEAIVIDDGSTDSTARIAQTLSDRDRRIRVVSTPNRGVSAARNAALDMARGEWVTFLDSDDLLPAGALAEYARLADSGADIIAGNWARVKTVPDTAAVSNKNPQHLSAKKALISGLYQTGISTMVGAKMYARRVVEKVRFQEDIRYEDLVFFCEALLASREVVVTDAVTYLYRDNPDSFINTFSPVRLDVLKATECIERMCTGDAELLRAARDRRLSAAYNMYGLLGVYDRDGRYEDVKKECWRLIKTYRGTSMLNPHVRLKNRVGILLSYLGRGALAAVSRVVYGK